MKAARSLPPEPVTNVIPLVAPKNAGNRPVWIAGAFLAVCALLLFLALDGRRRALTEPATTAPLGTRGQVIAAPPELIIPRNSPDRPIGGDPVPLFRVEAPRIAPRPSARFGVPAAAASAPAARAEPYRSETSAGYARDTGGTPQVYQPPVYDAPPPQQPREPERERKSSAGASSGRVYADRLVNPATTVPLGTVIPAVLETALDSTRPGALRAIVSRDVRGFDGTRILIPRGSRLYGEYGAELEPGQGRALVRWIRLVRPDGAMIELDSPASDPLGRAGIRGRVDSKFLERFGEALLQSTLDIGAGVAGRRIGGNALILSLPGTQPTRSVARGQGVRRTLRVGQGSSVSVFVARDLDFTPVEI